MKAIFRVKVENNERWTAKRGKISWWLTSFVLLQCFEFQAWFERKKTKLVRKRGKKLVFGEQSEPELFDVALTSSFYCQLSLRKLFHLREIQILRKLKFKRSAAWQKRECGRKKINGGRSMLIEISWTLNRYRHDDEKEREGGGGALEPPIKCRQDKRSPLSPSRPFIFYFPDRNYIASLFL